ncbi:hypothetical protein [Flavobacterium chungbukense]|jgi:hypothetical protein|uniref:Uncharacterized protein n=1 Tax=Flavobacterium chungbukense TaxID=877464 RepID=A0ABP7YIQ7_9FLAO|nr:hypothetical protein [Flavobacterium chungbukense]MCC4920155.1 hypothetical protein [Flavobacterium chungbukense]
MAIFGAGSKWEKNEMKNDFFKNENFVIGWNIKNAQDLYSQISTIKIGDIIFLKANKPGNLNLRIKGIGIVKDSFIGVLFDKEENLSLRKKNFELPVKWIVKSEFKISIPPDTGKLTHVRAGTLHEEYLPYVQKEIIGKIFNQLK